VDSEGKVTAKSIKAAGGYLDLDKYPLINTNEFYNLTPSEKIVVLYILKQHNYYTQNRFKDDILVTILILSLNIFPLHTVISKIHFP